MTWVISQGDRSFLNALKHIQGPVIYNNLEPPIQQR